MFTEIRNRKHRAILPGLLLILALLLVGCNGGSGGGGENAQANFGGQYAGTWTNAAGTETGTWSFTVDQNRAIAGVVTRDGFAGESAEGTGKVIWDGSFKFETTGNWIFVMNGVIVDTGDGGTVTDAGVSGDVTGTACGETAIRFGVISDPHYYDTDLGTTGPAFEAYLAGDRKLLRESPAILEAVIDGILEQKPQFVIVVGDLTKDGERSGHEKFALAVSRLKENGIPVYVIPGNHDINNPHAVSFDGAVTTPVPHVSPEEFVEIYNEFGYSQAIERDPNSLSYLIEPVAGLWLLALDSCIYDENETLGRPVTGGRFSQETLTWILEKLEEAKNEGKTVMAFMHHGIIEHYAGQSLFFGDYVIQNWPSVSATLAQAGLPLVFTGHYHAQDVTQQSNSVNTADSSPFIFDTETGSLVTYPCPYRVVDLGHTSKDVVMRSYRVQNIDYDTGNQAFQDYALEYLQEGLLPQVIYMLMNSLGVPQVKALMVAPDGVDAMTAHYAGDEAPTQEIWIKIGTYAADPDLAVAAQLMGSLWTDLPPADNKVGFNISTGDVQ